MTDMPAWRSWAERAHRASMSTPRPSKNPRFKCSACPGRTTKNQAKKSNGMCVYCKQPLRATLGGMRFTTDKPMEQSMTQHTVHYWLIGHPDQEADAAHDAGLTDCSWVKKGGMMFVEFTRAGATMEAVAREVADDLRRYGVPFDERTLNLRDPTDFLEEHAGYYDEDELRRIVGKLENHIALGIGGDAAERRYAILKANLEKLGTE